ncbi:MAG: translation initiation factor IF-5A [Nanoarchaeota archaeon]|nr:translation initiation factor IF-5A [Nanoarchaeota archaeon]
MALRLINAAQAKTGTSIIFEGVSCIVKSNDISKTGKHGHAKCRIEAISVIDDKKKVFVVGGHERMEVPMIEKHRAQMLNLAGSNVSIMDLESFETLEIPISEELKSEVKEGDQLEYWIVEGVKVLKRKI